MQKEPASIPKEREREIEKQVEERFFMGAEDVIIPVKSNRGRKPMTAEEKRNTRFARLNMTIREIKDALTGGGGMTKRETKALNTRLRKAERERDEILAIQSQSQLLKPKLERIESDPPLS